MKKYLRFTCDTCKRDTDKLVDITHYVPNKCVITLGCEGRLYPVEYKSSGGISTAPETGVIDWKPRNSSYVPLQKPVEVKLVSLSTGSLGQLVLASPHNQSSINVAFKIQADTPRSYRSYVFRKEGSFSTISGIESGLEKKALRFKSYGTDVDLIEVMVNGVRRERGGGPDDYQIYDGDSSSSVPPNTISFNTSIVSSGITQVDIIVSKEPAQNNVQLTFSRNQLDPSRLGLGSWENINSVEYIGEDTYYLYTLDLENANVTLNSILTPIDNSDALFLLARKPYSNLDRYTTIVLPLSNMSIERDYLKYYLVAGKADLQVTDTSLKSIYPSLVLNKFQTEMTYKTALLGVEEQITIDGNIIMGPDA